jgi:hypothetical protein
MCAMHIDFGETKIHVIFLSVFLLIIVAKPKKFWYL